MLNLPEILLLLPAIPIGLWVIWSDTKFMRIPNIACLYLFAGFLILGFLIFDLNEYGIRILQALIIFILGFLVSSIGLAGGGDAKFSAAMAPFIARGDVLPFILLIAIVSVICLITHKTIGRIPALRSYCEDWESWNNKGKFPYGVILAISLIVYLIMKTQGF